MKKRWTPKIPSGDQPLYQRICDAIASAIDNAELTAGARLPTQREMATRLAVSLGSITRAYEELARRGLIDSTVGRGSFVSAAPNHSEQSIDLSRNIPPIAPARAMLRETLAASKNRSGWDSGLDYGPPAGSLRDRAAGLAWLKQSAKLECTSTQEIFCTNGAHTALMIALATLLRPGDTLFCEAATYTGVATLATQQGYALTALAMDAQGLSPQALTQALSNKRLAANTSKVLVMLPTLQNPTASVMPLARRQEIVKIARQHGLWIIEDDIYGAYANEVPIANLAPERVLYLSSMAKAVAPGLRTGFLVAPKALQAKIAQTLSALAPTQSGLGQAIATHWIESGIAAEVASKIQAEVRLRTAMVKRILQAQLPSSRMLPSMPLTSQSLHLWWPVGHIDGFKLAEHAARHGILLNAPDQFAIDKKSGPTGIRLCLGGAANIAELERACHILCDPFLHANAASHVAAF